MMSYFFIGILLVAVELIFFRVADIVRIIDRPNRRSSHSDTTIRGGGIIFLVGAWAWFIYKILIHGIIGFNMYDDGYLWFLVGLTAISLISLADDVEPVPNNLRLLVHFASMMCCFVQLGFWSEDLWWAIAPALIVAVGIINGFNFMDGINGITGGYSLAVLIPLMFLNYDMKFIDQRLLIITSIRVLVFCMFNFRTHARCFAGDVGAISIAFIIMFALGSLMVKTGELTYLLFLVIYGVDSVLTIVHRIMLHEDLGVAHRKHAYQLMVNELKMKHTTVSTIYTVVQLAVSFGFIYLCPDTHDARRIYFAIASLVFGLLYIAFMRRYYHLHAEYLASKG